MVVIRYISKVLVWITTILALENATTSVFGKEVVADNVKALLIYAIVSTVFTVILLLIIFFMRKRVALTIALFHVAGKVFLHLPLLALQPFWTFLGLLLFWVYWLSVFMFLGISGTPMQNNVTGLVEFQMREPFQYLVWFHAVGLIWISEFLLAFQQMTIAGAVVTYYFTRSTRQRFTLEFVHS
ncbi:hypothetical protein CRUP_023802 [Coryphaenoides rupestris]|nr:hypothetical protein CRUP_023802 [Coryphaenoides rupestris]